MTRYIDNKTVDFYGSALIDGFSIDFYGVINDTLIYTVNGGKPKLASFRPCRWARGLHGNAPTGTHYGDYHLLLPNQKTIVVKEYL